MISHEHEFIFVHNGKCAGTAITKWLNPYLDDPTQKITPEFRRFCKERGVLWPEHAPAWMLREYLGQATYSDYYSFGFVRNPWDRLYSLYSYTIKREQPLWKESGLELRAFQLGIIDKSFPEWVESRKLGLLQKDMFRGTDGTMIVDFIGKFEDLENDFKKISKSVGFDCLDTINWNERVNSSGPKSDYQEYYNPTTRDIVAEYFTEDIDHFNYTFE